MRIIGGSQRGRKLIPPRDRSIRPALDRLRESIFAILDDHVEKARVLDLFAGVGAFGLEALSRGARHAHFVDRSRDSLAILRRNIETLAFEAWASWEEADALSSPDGGGRSASGVQVTEPARPFDLIFLDPPFPMFGAEADVERVWRRVGELLEAPVVAPEAILVVRSPSWWRGEVPIRAFDTRRQKDSTVHFFSRATAR